ncbi:MAG: hypothetical protein ABUT39_04460 [Acidobacteriota bacterium]
MAELAYDSELVERLAIVNEGNAAVHLERAEQQRGKREEAKAGSKWSQHEMLAASGFVLAASYWSMIAPRKAVDLYRRAARIYRSKGHSYWMILALASLNDRDIAEIPSFMEETKAPSPQAVAFSLVGTELANADHRERLAEHWRHAGNPPVGRLGVPLDYYGRCAWAMHAARTEKNSELFFAAGASYVHRAAEVIRSASHDRYHWQRLQSAVLPAEPEAVAMTAAMSSMSQSLFGASIREIPNLDAHGRLLVDIGEDLRRAVSGDKERYPR